MEKTIKIGRFDLNLINTKIFFRLGGLDSKGNEKVDFIEYFRFSLEVGNKKYITEQDFSIEFLEYIERNIPGMKIINSGKNYTLIWFYKKDQKKIFTALRFVEND